MDNEKLVQEYLKFYYEDRNVQLGTINSAKTLLEDLFTKKIYDRFPLSSLCFPAVTAIHLTGSRSEKLCNLTSDLDIMYEIGPALVYPDEAGVVRRFFQNVKDQFIHSSIKAFYLEEADHIGHYRITDSTGGYLYPQDFQTKFYTTFQIFSSQVDVFHHPKYEGPNQNNPAIQLTAYNNSGNDHVIALKLSKWPESITKTLVSKMTDSHFQKIKGKRFHNLLRFILYQN